MTLELWGCWDLDEKIVTVMVLEVILDIMMLFENLQLLWHIC
jgi:hypothetical protein